MKFVDPIFEFCDSMAKLDLDEAEFALLVAINTFSPGWILFLCRVKLYYITNIRTAITPCKHLLSATEYASNVFFRIISYVLITV